MILLAIATDEDRHSGHGTDPVLEEATSGSTDPDIEFSLAAVRSTLIDAAGTSDAAALGPAADVMAVAGTILSLCASTSCVSCLPASTTNYLMTV